MYFIKVGKFPGNMNYETIRVDIRYRIFLQSNKDDQRQPALSLTSESKSFLNTTHFMHCIFIILRITRYHLAAPPKYNALGERENVHVARMQITVWLKFSLSDWQNSDWCYYSMLENEAWLGDDIFATGKIIYHNHACHVIDNYGRRQPIGGLLLDWDSDVTLVLSDRHMGPFNKHGLTIIPA